MAPKTPKKTKKQAKASEARAEERRFELLETQLAQTQKTLDLVLAAVGQNAAAGAASQAPEQVEPNEALRRARMRGEGMLEDWDEDQYWIRLRPYDKGLGHLRKRTLCPELSKPLNGGTGKVGDIPEWVPRTPDVARAMTRQRQNNEIPMSPGLFDMATLQEREAIDQLEMQHRMASLGMAGMTPQQVLAEQKVAGRVKAVSRKSRPLSGRAKALAGLPPPPPPPAPPAAPAAVPVQEATVEKTRSRGKPSKVEDFAVTAGRAAQSQLDADITAAEETPIARENFRIQPRG